MSINIVGFVKKLLPSFSKSDLEADMQASLDAIGVVLTTLDQIAANPDLPEDVRNRAAFAAANLLISDYSEDA